jgi:hypothetical protein
MSKDLMSLEEIARQKEIREYRKEAALRILCSIGDRIEMPEWSQNRLDKDGKPIAVIDIAKRDAAAGTAVQYADALVRALGL